MSYVKNNLLSNETILYKANVHWFVFVPPAICLIMAYLLKDGGAAFTILIILGIYLLTKALIHRSCTEFVITNMRVIVKTGMIARNSVELRHEKVEGLSLGQDICGRIFNYGTLIVNGTGSGKTPVKNISGPLEFRKKALAAIEQNKS